MPSVLGGRQTSFLAVTALVSRPVISLANAKATRPKLISGGTGAGGRQGRGQTPQYCRVWAFERRGLQFSSHRPQRQSTPSPLPSRAEVFRQMCSGCSCARRRGGGWPLPPSEHSPCLSAAAHRPSGSAAALGGEWSSVVDSCFQELCCGGRAHLRDPSCCT